LSICRFTTLSFVESALLNVYEPWKVRPNPEVC